MSPSPLPYYRQRGFHLLCLAWAGLALLTALAPAGSNPSIAAPIAQAPPAATVAAP